MHNQFFKKSSPSPDSLEYSPISFNPLSIPISSLPYCCTNFLFLYSHSVEEMQQQNILRPPQQRTKYPIGVNLKAYSDHMNFHFPPLPSHFYSPRQQHSQNYPINFLFMYDLRDYHSKLCFPFHKLPSVQLRCHQIPRSPFLHIESLPLRRPLTRHSVCLSMLMLAQPYALHSQSII